jgi:hypothetical protein
VVRVGRLMSPPLPTAVHLVRGAQHAIVREVVN